MRPSLPSIPLLLSCLCLTPSAAAADAYTVQPLEEAPPKSLSEAVRKAVQSEGLRVLEGEEPYADFWWAKGLVTQDDPGRPGTDYGFLPDGGFVGVVRFHSRIRDYRGTRFKDGVFTLRKMTQPEDGDHLGVSPSRDFLLVCSPEADKSPKPVSGEKAVELSVEVAKAKHPIVLYLMKLFDDPADDALPRLVERKEDEYWIVDCRVPVEKEGASPVRLSLIVVGEAEPF